MTPVATIAKPVLESGDHLSRAEFHHTYCARPDIKKAELVKGIAYVASPVSVIYGEPHAALIGWLIAYRVRHSDLHVGDNLTVFLDAETEVQPDACMWREGPGGPHVSTDGYIEGAPQLVIEIAASSASYDLHEKREAYQRNGVLEYVVWRVRDGIVDWFRLSGGTYVRVEPDERGAIESRTFPGLRLNVPMLLAENLAGVIAELDIV